jgi:hypothetical protein
VQQFASSIIVGETNGVVDAITGSIADLPAGVVANFKGRVIGSNAVNNNEFATLGQVTSTSRAAISLTTTGTSGPATYSSVTGVLNIPEYQGGVTSFNTRTGAVTLTSSDVTTALGYTPVTDARTLSINGVTYDLTANRSWTVGVNPSAREIQTYIATASQTTFTVTGGYTVGLVDVFINGVRLTSSDYTATNGTTVVLTVGTMAGNIVDIIKYTSGIVNSISGSGTTNELAYFTASTTISSLTTATYPSLTELSYVKGVTSSIQTQLNGKQSTLTNPVTGTGTTNYLPKFTGASTIGNSLFIDTGTNAAYNNAGVAARTFIIQATSGRPLALEVIENSNVHAIYFYPNNSGFNRISSDYMSGGTFLPLSLTGRENNADLVLQTSGNVTIGTTTDSGYKLDVNGTGRYNQNNSSVGNATGIRLEQAGSGDVAISYLLSGVREWLMGVDNSDSDSFKINNITGSGDFNNTGLCITTGGNVGIGTASPNSSLAISISAFSNAGLKSYTTDNTGGISAYVNNQDPYTGYLDIYATRSGDGGTLGGSVIRFLNQTTSTTASAIERMRITSDGIIQISTTTSVPTTNNSIYSYSTNGLLYIQGGSVGLGLAGSGDRNNAIYINSSLNQTTFVTNNSERMRITSGGNVLIGTTTDNGMGRLQVSGAVNANAFNSTSNNNSIPFTTWTTITTVDASVMGMYLVVIGLAAGGLSDWAATGILYSNGTTATWINGPTNGSLVQLRISGTAIQVYQNGTSPSINLSYKLLKVA